MPSADQVPVKSTHSMMLWPKWVVLIAGSDRPMPGAVDFGIADHCERASREEAAQIAIALLADIAKLVLTPARVLLRHEPNPGREIPSRSEGSWLSNAGDQCCGQRRTDARDRIQPLAGRV